MATVDGITAEKAQEIEDASVVSGEVNPGNGHLILTTRGGTDIDAGSVVDDSAVVAHAADTSTHGVTEIVGAAEAQVLALKTLIEPIIASFVNAQHDHSDADDGGALNVFAGVRAVRTATQTIGNSASELVSFSATVHYDSHGFKTSNTVFTIPAGLDGVYDILVSVPWAGNGTGRRTIDIRRNDTSSDGSAGSTIGKTNPTVGHSVDYHQQASATRYLVAGDTIKVIVFQNSGGGLNILGNTNDSDTSITITRRL